MIDTYVHNIVTNNNTHIDGHATLSHFLQRQFSVHFVDLYLYNGTLADWTVQTFKFNIINYKKRIYENEFDTNWKPDKTWEDCSFDSWGSQSLSLSLRQKVLSPLSLLLYTRTFLAIYIFTSTKNFVSI